MEAITEEQIRLFRLRTHHLDRWYPLSRCAESPAPVGFRTRRVPENAFQNHRDCTERIWSMRRSKTLLQAWSIRGVPLVFPAE